MQSRSPSRSSGNNNNNNNNMRNGDIDKLDFDDNRIPRRSNIEGSDTSKPSGLLDDDESLLSDVVEGVIERDRKRMQGVVLRYTSFVVAVLNW